MAKRKTTYADHIAVITEKLDSIQAVLDSDITGTRGGAQAAGHAYSLLQFMRNQLETLERTVKQYERPPDEDGNGNP